MKSFFVLALATLASASTVQAASRSAPRCFMEPFPLLLQTHIENEQQCGLNNPYIINFICEPIRGLVADAVWLDFQLSRFEKEDSVVEEERQALEDQEAIFQQDVETGDVFPIDAMPSARPVRQGGEQVKVDFHHGALGAIAMGALGLGASKF